MRVGLVGRRSMAWLSGLRSVDGVEVVAVYDVLDSARDKMAQDSGARPASSFADLVGQVDAVGLGTPMQHHADQAVAALDADRHVLSEVTAAVTFEGLWRIEAARRRSGKLYLMAENYAYTRETALVRGMVAGGLFGDPGHLEGEYLHELKGMHVDAEGQPTWRAGWQVGIDGNTYCTHNLGPAMLWINAFDPEDRVASVVCMGSGRRVTQEHAQQDTTVTLCQTRAGRLIRLRLDMLSERPHLMDWQTLQGTLGVYERDRFGGPSKVWFKGDEAWRSLDGFAHLLPESYAEPPADAGHGGGDFGVARDFAVAALGHKAPELRPTDGLHWTAVGLASQVSIRSGGVPIRVPDLEDPHGLPATLDFEAPRG